MDECYKDEAEAGSSSSDEESPAKRARQMITGRGVTLAMLMQEGLIDPGEKILTVEYMGKTFTADLMKDGRINCLDSGQIFTSPSSWAIFCKQQVKPEKKSGCGWASVKYKGKKLDIWKSMWFKKQRETTGLYSSVTNSPAMSDHSPSPASHNGQHEDTPEPQDTKPKSQENQQTPTTDLNLDTSNDNCVYEVLDLSMSKTKKVETEVKRDQLTSSSVVVKHSSLGSRGTVSPDILVECVPFASKGSIQPFTISITSNCLLLMDFHCHVTSSEVVGYLGGKWDAANQRLSVEQAFPCRCRLGDKENAHLTDMEVQYNMQQRRLVLVGWYHSHPKKVAEPSLRDIESQMSYQLRGAGISYKPCLALILSPYASHSRRESDVRAFWVAPPPEDKPNEHGMPMAMTFNTVQDVFLTQDVLNEMTWLMEFYSGSPDLINFKHIWQQTYTYFDKLKSSISKKMPKDQTMESQLLMFLKELLLP